MTRPLLWIFPAAALSTGALACGSDPMATDGADALDQPLTPARCEAPASSEVDLGPFERRVLEPPSELSNWSAPRFVANSDTLVLHGRLRSTGRGVIATVGADGSGYRCISCDFAAELDLGRPQAFSDGRRILVQSPQRSNEVGERDHRHFVLECTPAITDCRRVRVSPIVGMYSKEALQERWPSVAPDDAHIAWTRLTRVGFRMLLGKLVERSDGYHVEEPRVLNRRIDDGTARGFSLGSAWFEIKGFADGGRTLLFASTLAQGSNLDAYEMDLGTGAIRRSTAHPDWDEESQVSADGRSVFVGSSRGSDVLTNLSLVPYPSVMDLALAPAVTRYYLAGEARRSAQQGLWLFPRGRGNGTSDARGVLLSEPGTGWFRTESIGTSWDSTRVAWSELRPGEDARRVLVGHFTRMPPRRPAPVRRTPSPAWAPLVEDVDERPPSGISVLRGAVSGTAELTALGGVGGGAFRVRYDGFSEDGRVVIDGEQSFGAAVAYGRFEQSLTASGCAAGSAAAHLTFHGSERTGCASAQLGSESSEWCY